MFPIRVRTLVSASIPAFLAAALLGGCTPSTSDRDLRPVTAQEGISLAVGTPASAFKSATRGIWVDPRRPETFAEGHILGAISIPFGSGDFEGTAREELRGFDPIIVYGDDYQDILANAASKRLIEIGFKNVYTLRGGIQQWIADGYEVEKAPSAPSARSGDQESR
jgi:rhodanese-related sulfurtransferase